MKHEINGWVVINLKHPRGINPFIVTNTFATTRTKSIKLFTEDSGSSWEYCKKSFGFSCVKSTSSITTPPTPNKQH